MNILNIAAYRFVALEDLAQMRAALRASAVELELKGTILLAAEGINLFLAGAATNLEALLQTLRSDARFAANFEQCGGAHFHGACFVFDERVSLDAALHQAGAAQGCAAPPLPA